ncbi:MAG: endolytic transglycosylase MltG [Acidimicrobiia bacterium]|nr:endolytic transglycosylase MltG [Acidimicrobiia bacterium]
MARRSSRRRPDVSDDRPGGGLDPLIGEPAGGVDPLARRSRAEAPPNRDPAPGDMLLDPEAIAEDEALFFGDDAWIRFRRPWGFWRRLLVLAGGLALVAGGAYWWGNSWLQRQLDPPGEPQGLFLVEIPSGAGVNGIARILANEGVVANATVARLWWRDAEDLQAGDYYFAENMSVDEARAVLEAGPIPPLGESITIPEGLWLSEIADRLTDSLPEFDPVELQAALSDGQIRSRFLPAGVTSLEGVLFPDTYRVDQRGESDERDLVRRMVEQFDTVATQLGYDEAPERIGLTPYQLLVAASIVEAEAARSVDRPKVARVIYNRLNEGMPLQMDATVLYAIGQRKSSLTLEDLDVDSPYNTRKFGGLPPTPIAAPGRESLTAAMNPEPGDWLYFVLVERDGTLFFTVDYDEFLVRAADARARGVF